MPPQRNTDLLTAAALAGAAALVIDHVPHPAVRLFAALPLLFVLPGYAVTMAAFGRRRFSLSHLSLLSLGLSFSASALAALVLNLATNGLRQGSWAIALAAIVWGACWAAFFRRRAPRPEGEQASVVRKGVRVRVGVRDVILLALAASVIAGAVVYARTPLVAKNVQGYTALSMVPSSKPAQPSVQVELVSQELSRQGFRLVVTIGPRVAYANRRIVLDPGQKLSITVAVPARPTRLTSVVAVLYRNTYPNVEYRAVHIWLSPKAGPTVTLPARPKPVARAPRSRTRTPPTAGSRTPPG